MKILEINVRETISKLKKLGAKKTFDGELVAFIYDFPDKRLKSEGKLLRVRKINDQAEFTFKSKLKKGKVKTNVEHQVNVDRFDSLHTILFSLGLKRKSYGNKHRVSFQLGKMHVDIDTCKGIPPYLEIEAPSSKELEKYVRKMGFRMDQTNSWTMRDVYKHYGKKL